MIFHPCCFPLERKGGLRTESIQAPTDTRAEGHLESGVRVPGGLPPGSNGDSRPEGLADHPRCGPSSPCEVRSDPVPGSCSAAAGLRRCGA